MPNYAKLAKALTSLVKGTQDVLPVAEREANLAKFLESSKVPQRLYHGTGQDINVFDVSKSAIKSKLGDGIYLTPTANKANDFAMIRRLQGQASSVMPLHASIKNPYEIHGLDNIPFNRIDRNKLKELDYDGIFLYDDKGNLTEAVAFEPNQVKSAIGNRGTYDTTKPDINEAHGGAVHMQVGGLTKLAKMLSKKHIAPQEEALRLAQQRAALPINRGGLGLPANNTAEMRARAMFPEHGYSGKGDALGDAKLPMWLSENPALANTYTSGSSANVMPLRYNKGKQVIVDAKGQNWSALDENTPIHLPERMVEDEEAKLLAELMGEKYHPSLKHEPKSSKTFKDVFRQKLFNNELNTNDLADYSARKGYDSLRFQDIVDVGPSGRFMSKEAFVPSNNTVILNPDNVRSRFAAFDPWRRDAATAAAMGVAAPDLLAKEPEMNKAQGGLAHFQVGGALKLADRIRAGNAGAKLIKSQPEVKASEALGQLMEKGFKKTTTTQADRTRVGGGNIGGAPFSVISEADPKYAGRVWGVMDEGTGSRLTNLTTPDTAWTTMLGSADQLKTNPVVFDKLKRQFVDAMKQGKLTPELEAKINHNLRLILGEGSEIRNPNIWKEADTFDKRAALADLMLGKGITPQKGGVALGGEKSGRGVIFKPTDTLIQETEPTLLHPQHGGDVDTFAAGPRLFSLEKQTEFRPDLHPGFPTMIHGKDLGFNMIPTPNEIYLPDWHKHFKDVKPERFQGPWAEDIISRRKNPTYTLKGSEGPGYYDLALGLKGEGLPSQDLNDAYIRHLIREGFKEGGSVDNQPSFDQRLKDAIAKHMAEGGEASQDMDVAGLLQNSMDRGKDVPKFDEGGTTKAEKTKGNPLTKYASAAKKIAVEEFLKEKEALSTPRGAKDVALKIGTSFTGQLPSLMNLAQRMIPSLNEPTSVMNPSGETQLKYRIPYDTEEQNEVLKRIGALGETEAPVVEFAGSLLGPAQLYKAIKGGLNAAKAR